MLARRQELIRNTVKVHECIEAEAPDQEMVTWLVAAMVTWEIQAAHTSVEKKPKK
jgi:hypothetical protein